MLASTSFQKCKYQLNSCNHQLVIYTTEIPLLAEELNTYSEQCIKYMYIVYTFMRTTTLGCEQPWPISQPVTHEFQPIPGLISCTGVTGERGVGITCHEHATQMAGLSSPKMLAAYTHLTQHTEWRAGTYPYTRSHSHYDIHIHEHTSLVSWRSLVQIPSKAAQLSF